MNLKNAFRFQNWLDALMTEAEERIKKHEDAQTMAKIMLRLLEEKEKIYVACSNAKKKLDIDIDVQKTVNSKRYSVARLLNYSGLAEQAKALSNKANECSDKIEMAILSTSVDYVEPFPFETDLEEVIKLWK